MSYIDKTYVNSWEQYKELRDWCWDKEIVMKVGKPIKLRDFMYYPDYTEKEINDWFDELRKKYPNDYQPEVPFWNTPTYVDVYLIRNCPIDFVQERLKFQYGKEYDEIKNGTSVYDTYKRNGLGKNFHYKILRKPNWHRIYKFVYTVGNTDEKRFYDESKHAVWLISIENKDNKYDWWNINEDVNYWAPRKELIPYTSNYLHVRGTMNIHRIIRMIKKWDLPAGVIVKVENLRFNISWHILIKK